MRLKTILIIISIILTEDLSSVLTADISQRLKDGKPLYGRRLGNGDEEDYRVGGVIAPVRYRSYMQPMPIELYVYCLLYTSDAADE